MKKILFILFVLCIVSLYIISKYIPFEENFTNEISNKNDKLYILWTGGYDSTFRVCQALIDEKKIVQPIYISDIIDNLPEKKNERRRSTKYEYDAMNIIRKEISKKYPHLSDNFLPLIDINKITIDNEIQFNMNILKKQKRVRRKTCQYGAIAQLSKNMNKKNYPTYLEISVEKEPHGSIMYRTIHNKVDYINGKYYLKKYLNNYDKSLEIFRYLSFPTLNYNKKDMLNIATKNGYRDILQLTWSCWYPINGKPCKKCIMCRERII